MSSVVAVAGGTGKLGRAIVESLVASGKYQVFVLTREGSEVKTEQLGAKVVSINYDSVDSIVQALQENNIDTLLSTIDSTAGAAPELTLIEAADRSTVTKRYIPSSWGIKYTPEAVEILTIPGGIRVADGKVASVDALQKTSLEYTTVINGFFLDYYVQPYIKSYLSPLTLAIDIANKAAAIPGSGNIPVVFTHTFDIAKFVVALLSQSTWEEESYIIGDKVTLNEFLAIAEEARGTKFDVTYDSLETLKSFQITELPAHPPIYPFFPKQMLQSMFAAFGVLFEWGFFDLKPEKTLNDQFPAIEPRSVKDLVNEAWRGK